MNSTETTTTPMKYYNNDDDVINTIFPTFIDSLSNHCKCTTTKTMSVHLHNNPIWTLKFDPLYPLFNGRKTNNNSTNFQKKKEIKNLPDPFINLCGRFHYFVEILHKNDIRNFVFVRNKTHIQKKMFASLHFYFMQFVPSQSTRFFILIRLTLLTIAVFLYNHFTHNFFSSFYKNNQSLLIVHIQFFKWQTTKYGIMSSRVRYQIPWIQTIFVGSFFFPSLLYKNEKEIYSKHWKGFLVELNKKIV